MEPINRDIAVLVWLLIAAVWVLARPDGREAIAGTT
jgi:hypothetical protein